MNDPVLVLEHIRRSFRQGEESLDVLKDCSLAVHRGEKVALVAPSGAGKSTLLHIAGLLEAPDGGTLRIAGQTPDSDATRTLLRRHKIGFVYQFHHLLPEFSARENIMLPQMIAGQTPQKTAQRADALLALVGLTARATHRPARLSGGEQQRIAMARALANAPDLLIADEPTGNLDPHTSALVFDVLCALVEKEGLGLFMATHNLDLATHMDRVVTIRDGSLVPFEGA